MKYSQIFINFFGFLGRWNFKALFSRMSRVYLFGEYYLQKFYCKSKRRKNGKKYQRNLFIYRRLCPLKFIYSNISRNSKRML
uniref:Uncharacterized protein n=1 Tax=Meloidogyne enterolobii TaxID=390850 RepID=A0A6V7URG0_MELEN|nr:unnamed protein product [Meloidogyne enterolobii]